MQCFAGLRELIGVREFTVHLPDGATALDLKRHVEDEHPRLRNRMGAVRVAASLDFLKDDEPLPPGAELALIPPVSGGAPGHDDTIRIVEDRLSLDAALSAVRGPDAGAVVTFIGTVRARSRGRDVVHLDYEVFQEMALERLHRIAREARLSSGALRIAVLHRTGRVPVGDDSVVIAVAAAHRDEGFKACRLVIEALKADVPIWKKEVYEEGESWVGWGS